MISIEQAHRYYQEAESAHDFDHVLRVLTLAEHIALAEGADVQVVRTAALLHDLGRGEQDATGRDHAAVSAERAQGILAGHAPDKVAAVVHAIAAHRFRSRPDPNTLEARVVFDADKLDAMGAFGIARVFAHAAARGARLWVPLKDAHSTKKVDARDHTATHEFVVKLSKLQERLTTSTGRAIGQERHAFMVVFFDRLEAETTGWQ